MNRHFILDAKKNEGVHVFFTIVKFASQKLKKNYKTDTNNSIPYIENFQFIK